MPPTAVLASTPPRATIIDLTKAKAPKRGRPQVKSDKPIIDLTERN